MSGSRRADRLAQVLREAIAGMLLQEVSDPVLADVSVTDLKVAKDLKAAKVFYMTLNPGSSKQIQGSLDRVVPFLRRQIARTTEVRFVPQLEFVHDDHTENLSHLMKLIDSANAEAQVSGGTDL